MPDLEDNFARERKALADLVREAREMKAWSVRHLADAVGVSHQTIYALEAADSGTNGPGIWLLCRVGVVLGVDIAGLVLRSSAAQKLAVINRQSMALLERAHTRSEINALRWPAHYRYGYSLQEGDEIVSIREFEKLRGDCDRKLVEILSREEDVSE